MKKSLTALVLLAGLASFGVSLVAAAEEKPKTSSSAVVILTDSSTGMSRLGEKKMELRLNALPGERNILTAPRVLVDENKVKINPLGRQTIAFAGQLATKDVVVGRTGSVPGRPITAKALYLIAEKVTVVTKDNKAKFPGAGKAQVVGKAGKFDAGKGVVAFHAIENGAQPILLLTKDGKPLEIKDFPARARATGRLRVGEKGALVLEAETVEKEGREK
jgi:hypothetical protein